MEKTKEQRAATIYNNFLIMGQGFKLEGGRAILLGTGASPVAQQLVDSCGPYLIALVPAGGVLPRAPRVVMGRGKMESITKGIEGAKRNAAKTKAIVKRRRYSKRK